MKSFARVFFSLILFATLAACGGGGSTPANSNSTGSGTSANSNPVPANSAEGSWLSFSPAAIDVVQYQGDTRPQITITGTSSKVIDGGFNIAIIDSMGVLQPGFWFGKLNQMQYTVGVYTASALAVGTYSTYLEVRMCRDDARVCNAPVSGSPWFVPFKVTVRSNTNLTPLQVLPQLASWSSNLGNTSHNSYVPASFNASAFIRRWNLVGPGTWRVVNDGGLIFGTQSTQGLNEVVAINEDNGSSVWRAQLGDGSTISRLAPANGRVYATSSKSTLLWSLDQKTGAIVSKVSMDVGSNPNYASQINDAPTVYGQDVYVPNDPIYLSGLKAVSKFSGAGSALAWNADLPGNTIYSPAVDADHAYLYTGGAMVAVNSKDGTIAYKVQSVGDINHANSSAPVVLSGNKMAFVHNGVSLNAFNLSTRTVAWSQTVSSQSVPVYANNVIYIATWNGLQARSADSGNLLWSSETLATDASDIIVTDNLVFVCSSAQTLAIDLNTHQTVWRHPVAGGLSISNRGVLYINSVKAIDAINLQ